MSQMTNLQLRTLADQLWADLEKRYSDDPDLGLAKSIERKLATMAGFASSSKPKPEPKADTHDAAPKHSPSRLDDLIVSTSIRLFKDQIRDPAAAKFMVEELRKAGVKIPGEGRSASSKISNIYSNRTEIFRKVGGGSKKVTANWHLQPGV